VLKPNRRLSGEMGSTPHGADAPGGEVTIDLSFELSNRICPDGASACAFSTTYQTYPMLNCRLLLKTVFIGNEVTKA
jgi:hypothetical protein